MTSQDTKHKRKLSSENDNVYPIFKKKPKGSSTNDADGGQSKLQDYVGDASVDFNANATLTKFQSLLDFSQLENHEDITKRFKEISQTMVQNIRLVVRRVSEGNETKEVELEILEAELYLLMGGGLHEDPFTHGSEEQKASGRWYFHRAPKFSKDSTRSLTSSSEYRDGSRKGLDLTLGSSSFTLASSHSTSPLCGGILLRTIREAKTRKIISGPSLLVDKILSESGVSDIKELVENKWGSDISAFLPPDTTRTCLYLKAVPRTRPLPIYYSPRIGLELSHPGTTPASTSPIHPRVIFLPRCYRFLIAPELLTSKGRPQTFLGVLYSLIDSNSSEDLTRALKKPGLSRRVASICGLKENTADKYLKDYIAGREGGATLLDNNFIGPKGKGASSSPATYLKMMGAISTLQLR